MNASGTGLIAHWDRVNGRRMYARVAMPSGAPDGATHDLPFVLVHGLSVSSRYLVPAAQRLAAAGFRAYVPDLPGFGRSEKPRHVLSIPELAAALSAWMDVHEITRAALFANSLGCQIAVRLAIKQPERVAAAVLVAPTADPEWRSLGQHALRLAADALLEPPLLLPLVLHDYLRAGLRRTLRTMYYVLRDPIEREMARVPVPALVVRGAHDPLVSQRWAEQAAHLLPRGALVVIPRAAHAAHFSRPDAVVAATLEFMRAQGLMESRPAAAGLSAADAPGRIATSRPWRLPPAR